MQINSQPQRYNPVYSPNQWDFSSQEYSGPFPDTNYNLKISFVTTAITSGMNYTVGGYNFIISDDPTQNEIPSPSVTVYQDFINFVKEGFQNNQAFNNYQITFNYSNANLVYVNIKDKKQFSNTRLTYTASTSAITFTETIPDFQNDSQALENYSMFTEIYKCNRGFNLNYELPNDQLETEYITQLYKTSQPDNHFIFNYSNILQSYSKTDLWNTTNSSGVTPTIFQKDLNSLLNYQLMIYNSYTDDFGGSNSTTRKYYDSTENDRFIWDASRGPDFDSTPYWLTEAFDDFMKVSSTTVNGLYKLEFNYQIPVDDTLFISSTGTSIDFTASTFNSGANFLIGSTMSATSQNFISAFTSFFTGFSASFETFGYSKSIITLSANTYGEALNISNSPSGKMKLIEEIDPYVNNYVITTLPFSQIKFLTDRPDDVSIFYQYTNDVEIYNKQLSLSIFLANFSSGDAQTKYSAQTFQVVCEGYQGNIWSEIATSDEKTFVKSGDTNGLYHINVDPLLYNGNINIEKYKFYVRMKFYPATGGSANLQYSEEKIFAAAQVCNYQDVKSFTWLNDLGGWDYYDFIRDKETVFARESTLISNDNNEIIRKQTTYESMFQNSIEQSYKLSTIVSSKEEYDWLYQMIKSSRVYLIENLNEPDVDSNDHDVNDDYLLPVIITNSDYSIIENNNKWLLNIEYRVAKKDISQKSV